MCFSLPLSYCLTGILYSESNFRLIGHSHAIANLSIGVLTLDPINFNVPSNLKGMRGLKNDTTITGVDVIGGTSDAMQLSINGEHIYRLLKCNVN